MKALPVLMYHHVTPAPGLVTVAPQTFREHMAALARGGWQTLGSAAVARFFAGESLPEKSVVISFDDGYLDNFIHAHPILQEYGLHGVLFLATAWMGEGKPRDDRVECPNHGRCKQLIAAGQADEVALRWSEVETMATAGTFEFHSHTHTHTRWDKQGLSSQACTDAMEEDIRRSRESLVQHLGHCSSHLCWPQGFYTEDYIAAAQRQGFEYLYTTEKRTNLPQGNPLKIGRVVTKERPGPWLTRRLRIYSSPCLSSIYALLRGA